MKKLLAGLFFALAVALLPAPAMPQFSGCQAGFCSPDDGSDVTPISNACTNSSGTTITFTAQGVGNAQANRISVVSINWDDSTVANTAELTAVSIGGVSMTRAVRAAGDDQSSNSEIWYALNPTGTSANIVLTFSTAVDAVTIETYRMVGYNSIVATTTGTTSVSQAYSNKQVALASASRRTNVSTSLSNMVNDFSTACGANLWGVHASQRLNGNNQTLTSTISPTSSTPLIALVVWAVGAPQVACTESIAFLARTTGLNAAHQNNYANFICGVVSDGDWGSFDAIYLFATQDSTTALLNLVSSSYTGITHGSPTFTADRGFTGVNGSTTVYIDSQFNPTTAVHSSLNDAHVSTWSNTTGQDNGSSLGSTNGAGNVIDLFPRYTDDGAYFGVNGAQIGPATLTPLNGLGFYVATRISGATLVGYKNGSQIISASSTSSFSLNFSMYILAVHDASLGAQTGSGRQTSATTMGSNLTAAANTRVYNRMRTYMTAVGVP